MPNVPLLPGGGIREAYPFSKGGAASFCPNGFHCLWGGLGPKYAHAMQGGEEIAFSIAIDCLFLTWNERGEKEEDNPHLPLSPILHHESTPPPPPFHSQLLLSGVLKVKGDTIQERKRGLSSLPLLLLPVTVLICSGSG